MPNLLLNVTFFKIIDCWNKIITYSWVQDNICWSWDTRRLVFTQMFGSRVEIRLGMSVSRIQVKLINKNV